MHVLCKLFGHKALPCSWGNPSVSGFIVICLRCGTWLAAHPTADNPLTNLDPQPPDGG